MYWTYFYVNQTLREKKVQASTDLSPIGHRFEIYTVMWLKLTLIVIRIIMIYLIITFYMLEHDPSALHTLNL